ncbi:glycosylphosphatidylinositol anchor attachment 1 protein [Culicoides brevitarsis]|uniref:glycosylphosphatidylinositol anchor attachment 1 protein n=1 Tax=Culicoides brevitarsis TaxID=469753 RepID=UPI00307C0D8D
MGLLTDPSVVQQRKYFVKVLIQYGRRICFLLYLAGVVWFGCLAHNDLNTATYFSENALLPGLVYSEIRSTELGNIARRLLDDLNAERETHNTDTPHAFLLAKMKKIGLDTYTHNFTLNYPLGSRKVYEGKNVYGILRAPRIASTEAIVISVPYRAPNSVHPQVTHGIPLILAFAEFARKQKYWAKDIIFLVTEQEQLGMQAWLEAYHGFDDNPVLRSGSLDARAGQIQAAINLEVQDFDVEKINVKLEGLNGQLPNLDLHNLVQKLSHKQSILTGYKVAGDGRRGITFEDRLMNLLSMVFSQASGVPTGNHGLFHKYGIEAVTLECLKPMSTSDSRRRTGIVSLLKIVEGITRSLNNLLERFHQSYFFYLIVAYDRFVSIGDYIWSIALMAGALLIKSFIMWLKLNLPEEEDDKKSEKKEIFVPKKEISFDYLKVGTVIILAHVAGVLTSYLPFMENWNQFIFENNIPTVKGVYYALQIGNAIGLMIPCFIRLTKEAAELLHIALLLEVGTALIAISMVNFSLGFLLSLVTVPFVLILDPTWMTENTLKNVLSRGLYLLMHPLFVVYATVAVLTFSQFPELNFLSIFHRAYTATLDGLTYSVVDSVIYGNFLFALISLIFFPTWIMLFTTLSATGHKQVDVKQKQQ